MTKLAVRFTDVAYKSIDDLVEHFANHYPGDLALQKIGDDLDAIVSKVTDSPKGYPMSNQAIELGVIGYRELNTAGYRVFYELIDSVIVIQLIIRQKQSVERALIRYCLLKE